MIGLHHVFMSLTPTSQHLRSAVPRCSTGLSCFGVAACLPCGRWANWIEVQLAVQLGYWDEQVTQWLLNHVTVKHFETSLPPFKKNVYDSLWYVIIGFPIQIATTWVWKSPLHQSPAPKAHHNWHQKPTPACPPATLTASRTPWRCSPAFRGRCGYTWVPWSSAQSDITHPWELPDIMWI